MSKKNITGIVLAGGKNSRMGSDKGLLMLDGRRFIDQILASLIPLVDEVIIISNSNNYDHLGFKVFSDIVTDCGPMGGIYTGLVNSSTVKNIILSCDIPFITSPVLSHIIGESENCEIAIPEHGGKLEPLCAVYTKNCAEKLRTLLDNKEWKMQEAIKNFVTKKVRFSQSTEIEKSFLNINTPFEFIQQNVK